MNPNTIQNFISLVKTEGAARASKFAVEITLPNKMVGSTVSSKMRNILLYCDSATLPGVNIATTANRVFGESRETPYEKLFDTLPLTFYVDNAMVVRSLFDEWVGVIQDVNTRQFSYYDDYITKVTITAFDLQQRPRYKIELFEAYPKSIGSIDLSYSNKDIMKLGVTFVFKYWNTIPVAAVGTGPDREPNILNKIGAAINDTIRGVTSIPQRYLQDFAGFQNQFQNGRNMASGNSQGIFTGLGQ